MLMKQAPVRNQSVIGAQVYSHSGEYSPRVIEFMLPGRGLSFEFARKYRSSHHEQLGPLGRGWTFTYAKRLDQTDAGIIYSDGLGGTHLFRQADASDTFISPDGFYAILKAEGDHLLLKQRHGYCFIFEKPVNGGRLLSIRDRNNNNLEFDYPDGAIHVHDTLNRIIIFRLAQDRVIEVLDHTDRVWNYEYNHDGCLVTIVQPPPTTRAQLPHIRYAYDDAFRLISVTDPKGQTFLRNSYDADDRVIRQEHGNGVYEFQYKVIGKIDGSDGRDGDSSHTYGDTNGSDFSIYQTSALLKNGARLELTHNATGHVIKRTMLVNAESLADKLYERIQNDKVSLTTISAYNRHGEVVHRIFPAENTLRWDYQEDDIDPRNRGNLLSSTAVPAEGIESDQEYIVTSYTYESDFQRRSSITNPRGHIIEFEYDDCGNLIRKIYPEVAVTNLANSESAVRSTIRRQLTEQFEYNAAGQLIRVIDARQSVTEYHYYALDEQVGMNRRHSAHNDAQSQGGLLARVTRYPNENGTTKDSGDQQVAVVQEFGYDPYSNITTVWDSKGNATHLTYNAHSRLIHITMPDPFAYEIEIQYDANGNLIESSITFDRQELDRSGERVVEMASTVTQSLEYNTLNNIIRRTITGSDRAITEVFERDSNENIVRIIQPLGTIFEYRFDERNLLLERRLGVGTTDEVTVSYRYTPNGRRYSRTDGRAQTLTYHYDGYHRYRGFTNPAGTTKTQWFDEAGNVVRIAVTGDVGVPDEQGGPVGMTEAVLLENRMHYDELNRRIRVDRAWRNVITGETMGQSQWDSTNGVVSIITEYNNSHLPARIWDEMGNIITLEYDGINRVVSAYNSSGNTFTIAYDANNNPVRIEHLGPEVDNPEERFQEIIHNRYDQLNRLVDRSVNYELPETLIYNALGAVLRYTSRTGKAIQYLHDAFGRQVGVATMISPHDAPQSQFITHQIELDDNNHVIAYTNPSGIRTQYKYDVLSRRSGVKYPDGTMKRFKRDGRGNIVRIIDQNGNTITHEFDSLNRLISRRIIPARGGTPQVEQYQYDGVNRLVAVSANGIITRRHYDTLSRMLGETQNGRTLSYEYDPAGNLFRTRYPSGQQVEKRYDKLRRVVEVHHETRILAQYSYRTGRQLNAMKLGTIAQARFTYRACQGCLSELTYHSLEHNTLITGSRYVYDKAGNRTAEIHLHRGATFGKRYTYDAINRRIGVQHGVENVIAPDSPFELEEQLELNNLGSWQRKIIRRADGQIVAQLEGTRNERGMVTSLGRYRFTHDPNGNCVRKTNDGEDFTEKRFTYDYANRLTLIESIGDSGDIHQAVEYTYDVFGRQVGKRVTDSNGTREIERVWNGCQLIEEWEDGDIARSFHYGAVANQPVSMTRNTKNGVEQFFYTYNGRGQATALVSSDGTVVERYSSDGCCKPTLEEVNGQPVGTLPQSIDDWLGRLDGRLPASRTEQPVWLEEGVTTPIVGTPVMGCGLWDQEAGLAFSPSGGAYDPTTNQLTNPESRNGKPGCGNGCSAPEGFDPRMASNGEGSPFWESGPYKAYETAKLSAAYILAQVGATVAEASLLPFRIAGLTQGTTLENKTVWGMVHDGLAPHIEHAAHGVFGNSHGNSPSTRSPSTGTPGAGTVTVAVAEDPMGSMLNVRC